MRTNAGLVRLPGPGHEASKFDAVQDSARPYVRLVAELGSWLLGPAYVYQHEHIENDKHSSNDQQRCATTAGEPSLRQKVARHKGRHACKESGIGSIEAEALPPREVTHPRSLAWRTGTDNILHDSSWPEWVTPGSYLALSHVASDIDPGQIAEATARLNQLSRQHFTLRDHDQVLRFFEGLELLEPGVVRVENWRASELETRYRSAMWGGVARKP